MPWTAILMYAEWPRGFSLKWFLSTTGNSIFTHHDDFSVSYWQLLFLVMLVCKQLVTFGRAEVARCVDVSLLHSPSSVLLFLASMASPVCTAGVKHSLSLHCYCICLYWVGSCWLSPCCCLCTSVLISYCPICVLTVLALALLIHVHQVFAFIYEVSDFISITACGCSCLIQDIS